MSVVEDRFPGIFESYVASIIEHWQTQGAAEVLAALNTDLDHLDLNGGVVAVRMNEAQLELLVRRTKGAKDLVNIADVGFGVSQAISILVALRVAAGGQLVYVEEPEQHLHPRAQTRMADVLADAAKRGVKVVVETHSDLLLRGVQTLIAKQQLDPKLVRLHWFTRNKSGVTQVRSAQMDRNGAFGVWPEDFGDVMLESEKEYLDAVEARVYR
jgi:predicted ATPase